jgi:hypothetical protein
MFKNMLQRLFLAALLSCAAMQVHAKVVVVSPDGEELQQAFNNAAEGDFFFLKNGIYTRTPPTGSPVFELPTNARQASINGITIIGESRDGVRIQGNKSGGGAEERSAFLIFGNDWYIENVTVENVSAIGTGQAEALHSKGDKLIFNNVRLRSYQDTHKAEKGMQYCFKCETRGDVDFIWGGAALMYDSSLIVSLRTGYVTAPSNSAVTTGTFRHGIVIKNSELTAEGSITSSLGRPHEASSSSVFLNNILGSHITPAGWTAWSGSELGTYMAEWNSRQPNGTPVNTVSRISWSKQLTAADTSKYGIAYFFKGWNPLVKVNSQLLDCPVNIRVEGDTLRWSEVPNAMGYLIFRNDSLLDFAALGEYNVSGKTGEKYTIKTVNEFGRPGSDTSLKTAQTITWAQELSATVGDENIVLNATTGNGLPVTYTTSASAVAEIVNGNELKILSAGKVTVTAMQLGNDEYVATSVSKTFNVQKISQTITWEQDLSAAVGDANIVLNATASSGLVVSYSSSALDVAKIVNGNELQALSVGEVTITASQNGNAAAYAAAASVPKTFTVSKAIQTITWEQPLSLKAGENITLDATSSSGLTVSYSVENTEVASIFSVFLTGKKDGVTTITASQAGNENYSAVTLERTVTVGDGGGATGVSHNEQIPVRVYPNPVDDLLSLNFDSEGTYDLLIADLSGTVVYKNKVSGSSHVIDASSYASGTYLLSIENAQKQRTVVKVVVK